MTWTSSDQPGVTVERRQVLRFASLACCLPFAGSALARGAPAHPGEAFEEFAAFWKELGVCHLDGDLLQEDPYLYRLAGRVAAMELGAFPPMERAVFESEAFQSGPAFFDGRVFMIVLRVQPGALIRPHDHPGFNVATLLLKGSAHYAHFEPLGDVPERSDHEQGFQVRKTRSGFLLPGRVTHLSQTRDNMHTFRAGPEGATLLDFNTRLGNEDFGMFSYDEEAQGFEGIHDAHWIEKKF